MREKIVGVFFSVLSWGIWAVSVCVIFFGLGLLIFGAGRPPQFTLENAALSKAEASDPVLAQNGENDENWYKLELIMRVSADRFSPFTYTVGRFDLKAPQDLKNENEYFVILDEPLAYTKLSPDDYLLTLYLHYPAGEEALQRRLGEIGFGMREMYQSFAFFKSEVRSDMPGFYLSELME